EQRAVTTGGDLCSGGRPAAQRIAFGRFQLDDLRAPVGEELGAVGAGDPTREVDDDVVSQRRRHSGAARPFLLSRHSGGNRLSKSFTAFDRPSSMASSVTSSFWSGRP